MHSLMVIIDGLGDDPIPQFGGKTPFEFASHPNIDKLLTLRQKAWAAFCAFWAWNRRTFR